LTLAFFIRGTLIQNSQRVVIDIHRLLPLELGGDKSEASYPEPDGLGINQNIMENNLTVIKQIRS
jgi:hypothetical protein